MSGVVTEVLNTQNGRMHPCCLKNGVSYCCAYYKDSLFLTGGYYEDNVIYCWVYDGTFYKIKH